MIDADDDETVQVARPLPAPTTPSNAQREAHECTHLPYRSWCPHCVAARKSNSHHRRSSSSQCTLPLLVADYCQLKDTDDGVEGITALVARIYPARALLATVVDAKGPEDNAVARVANLIRDSGYSWMVYRTDQEASIISLFEEAFRRSLRQGNLYNERLERFTPGASVIGEAQSNGKAENAVQRVEDLVRTYKAALESRLQCKVPIGHPIMRWMVEHAASLYNRYVTNEDGATPFEVLHGQRVRGNIAEFGEQCLYFVLKKLRAKLNRRFRMGTFLGNTQNSNEAFVANAKGEVTKTRAVVRVVEQSRWSKQSVLGVVGVPSKLRPSVVAESDAHIEEFLDPHSNGNQEDAVEGPDNRGDHSGPRHQALPKQQRITVSDIEKYGATDGCPRRRDLTAGLHGSERNHSDECRLKIYLHWKGDNRPKWRAVKHLCESQEKKFSRGQDDKEGSSAIPETDDILDLPDDIVDDPPARDLDPPAETPAPELSSGIATPQAMDEDQVADMFGDFDGDEDMKTRTESMVNALILAGANDTAAQEATIPMFATNAPTATFTEVYGRSISDYNAMHRRRLNVKGLDALDLRTVKANRKSWNFCKRKDRQEARKLIERKKHLWVIGAPPCTSFSTWNHCINHQRMDPQKVRDQLREGRLHLQCACSLYRKQVAAGTYFLHEHQATAMSWNEDSVNAVARLPTVHTVVGGQCQYGLVTPSEADPTVMLPALKPTKFMTKNQVMRDQLGRRCSRDHAHQPKNAVF